MSRRKMKALHTAALSSLLSSAHGLCATPSSLYRPFLDSALTIFEEAGLDLHDYPLDDSLLQRSATTGPSSRPESVDLTLRAFGTVELRQARLALIEGGSALQVLNFCIFPHLSYGLPTFAADLVTLPGGHLIALDWAPNGAPTETAYASDGPLAACFARHREQLPDGGALPDAAKAYFSPYFLWSRLPAGEESDAAVSSNVRAAFDDYLRAYLQLVASAEPLQDKAALGEVREAQLSYSRYRAASDPARPMLTRLFGGEFAEELIADALFDLDAWIATSGEGEQGTVGVR